jgi:hypothetical protein
MTNDAYMSSATISAESNVTPAPGVTLQDLGEAAVLVCDTPPAHFGLSRMGRQIWLLLPEAGSVSEIVARLRQEFDVAESECTADVIEFLQSLADGGLIEVS